jgi:hypothetical protein
VKLLLYPGSNEEVGTVDEVVVILLELFTKAGW